ncbi:copper-binding protein [Novosphingobium sp.]|uniref:copper-binding protein n=1 Tax=Novosphingobium sp. TaxID=1874826 RepID=UPI00333E2EE9
MTRTTATIVVTLLAASLAACSKPAETPQSASPQTLPDTPMPGMSMPAQPRTGHATGVVTAIDTAAGKITLDHGPVAELQWPAMKMAFGATAKLLNGIAVGDTVAFKFTVTGTSAEITEISKQ